MSAQELIRKSSTPLEFKSGVKAFLQASSKTPRSNFIKQKAQLYNLVKQYSQQPTVQPQLVQLILFLSEVQLNDSEQYLAAKALQMIRLNSPNNQLTPKDRIDIQLKICQYFIAAKDVYSGEDTYKDIKNIKFQNIEGIDVEEAQFMEMRFKLIDAQYLRNLGRHADAGLIYLSYVGTPKLQDYPAQRDKIIESVIICMILAGQSPKRASLLANLYENQIIKKHPLFEFVEKILFGNIITKEDSLIIKDKLAISQQKVDDDEVTPLEKAIFQHNIRCLLKVYRDISFKTLGQLLGISNNISFFTQLQKMIENGFPAQIDQVSEFVTFVPNEASEKSYNQRITAYCESLQRFIDNNKQ